MKQKHSVLFILMVALAACSGKKNQEAIAEGNSYFVTHIEQFVIKAQWGEVLHQKQLMRSAANMNAYLLMHYYLVMQNDAAAEKKLDKALLYSDSLTKLYQRSNKDFQKAFEMNYINALCLKAAMLFEQNRYFEAYDIYYKVADWNEHNKQPFAANFFLFTMGMNSYQQKLYDKAAFFFKKQLYNIYATPDTDTLLGPHYRYFYTQQALSNVGLCYTKLNMLDSAYSYYIHALQFIDSARDHSIKGFNLHEDDYHSCLAVISGNLAKVYAKKGLEDSAIATYKRSIYYTLDVPVTLKLFTRDTVDACLSMIQLAELYNQQKDESNFKATVDRLNSVVPNNLRGHWLMTNNDYVLGSLKVNYWYSSMQHNNEAALYFLNRYVTYKDSLELLQKEGKDKNIIQALEARAKEDEVSKLKLTNKIDRLYIWGIVSIALVVALVAFLFYRSNKKEKQTNKLLTNLNNEIKQQQKETAFAHEQALEANKDKDRILHVVAHDLRNPLTGIATLADLMLEDTEDDQQQDILQTISSSSKRATQLVNDLVNTQYHKTETLELSTISLNKLLKEVMPLFQHKASEKNISLQLSLPSVDVQAMVDWAKLERVVTNLLHNAIKFSNNNGEVKLALETKDNKAIISVSDKGIGMNNEMLNKLMNTKSSIVRDGTNGEKSYGLGWNICKQIVEAHQGKLIVESKEKEGTIISIELERI